MKFKVHPAQAEVLFHPARFKVVAAGRRWGKSVLSRMWILSMAMEVPGTYWIVSPTFSMAKDIHWKQGFLQEVPERIIKKINQADLEITLVNNSRIALKSAEHPDRLRGVKLNGLVVDEVASIRNWDWLWGEVLRPTLTDYMAPAMFISTPAGFNHFHTLFLFGQENSETYDPNYQSWQWTSYDNKYVPREDIDSARLELSPDTFAQEYMADFRKMEGLIYNDFDRETHVVKPFDIPKEWKIYRSMDFGSNNPTVCLWIAVDDDRNYYVFGEHYEPGQTIDYHAGEVLSRSKGLNVQATYGDPSGVAWIKEFGTRGLHITKANKDRGTATTKWVNYGINKVQEKLKVRPGHFVDAVGLDGRMGYPSLFVFNTCGNTISEFETYRWKEKSSNLASDLNEPEAPEKANDHAMDALRYFVVSHQEHVVYSEPPKQWGDRDWKIGA